MNTQQWRKTAACRDMDMKLFFPDKYREAQQAKEVCYGCPSRRACLAYALRTRTYEGVWGGFYGQEIKKKGRRFFEQSDELIARRKPQVLCVAPYWGKVPFGHHDSQRNR